MHEWVESRGGAEKVLEAIADTFPDAPVLVPWSDAPERLAGHDVRQSRLADSPLRRNKPLAALVMPMMWRRVVPRRAKFEWVIASSHLFSHHVRVAGTSGEAPKFVYVHSPARYIWNPELDKRGAGPLARTMGAALKPVDRRRAQEAHRIAANSEYVRGRVQDAWGRDAVVIHPPVDIAGVLARSTDFESLTLRETATLRALPTDFILGASRFVAYKELDAVIAAGEAAGLPVVLAGSGPEEQWLRHLSERASVPVSFVIAPSDTVLAVLYARARVFVFPAVEDFGIVPVEAMAAGTPVVARRKGGTLETVRDGVSGLLIDDFADNASVAEAIRRAAALPRQAVRAHAEQFSTEAFGSRLRGWVAEGLAG